MCWQLLSPASALIVPAFMYFVASICLATKTASDHGGLVFSIVVLLHIMDGCTIAVLERARFMRDFAFLFAVIKEILTIAWLSGLYGYDEQHHCATYESELLVMNADMICACVTNI